MKTLSSTYFSTTSPVHACDARVKIALLFAFTLCLFFAETWWGLAAFTAMAIAAMAASRVPLGRYFNVLQPVYMIMGFTVFFNIFAGSDVVATLGPLTITSDGLSRGCFFALRILLLCLGSMVVCYTTTSTSLTDALGWALGPLRRLHVPVDDVTTTLSIALRFIPLLSLEVGRVHDAHWSRGARFDGTLREKLGAWGGVFVAVFVGMFRRADRLASAMDARCYGIPGVTRTTLGVARMTGTSALTLVGGLALCLAIALLL